MSGSAVWQRVSVRRNEEAAMNWLACAPHYWLIDPPRAPESLGVCRRCGQERWFQNWLERKHTLQNGRIGIQPTVTPYRQTGVARIGQGPHNY